MPDVSDFSESRIPNTAGREARQERRAVPRGGRRPEDASALSAAIDRVRYALPSAEAPLLLVVDDFPDGRELVAEYFAFLGFRVAEARTGGEALEKATTLLPDVVLMDYVLPDTNGLEVIAQLRASERTRHLKIALCTAAVMADVRARSTRALVDMFIPKPFDLPVLALQVGSLVEQHAASVAKAAAGIAGQE